MKKFLSLIFIVLIATSIFAVEKQKVYGNCTLYFDTNDVDKYYIDVRKTTLENDLVIGKKVDSFIVEMLSTNLFDSQIQDSDKDFWQCVKTIIVNNLAGGRIYDSKNKTWTFVFKDEGGNLYYAN